MGATKPSFVEKWKADGTFDKKLKAIRLHAQWGTRLDIIARGLGVTLRTFMRMKVDDPDVAKALEEGNLEYTANLYENFDTLMLDLFTNPNIPLPIKLEWFEKHIKRQDRIHRPDLEPIISSKDSPNGSSETPSTTVNISFDSNQDIPASDWKLGGDGEDGEGES